MAESDQKPKNSTQDLHYIKSNLFRVISVEGAIGGVAPNNTIAVSLFNQRSPIPKKHELIVSEEGEILNAKEHRRTGLVREVEVHFQLSLEGAKEFKKWLEARINELEDRQSSPNAKGN